MAITRPRTRLVYFRISEEEFREMVELCEKVGARSVSDFARAAVREFILNRERQQGSVPENMAELARLLDELRANLQQMTTDSAASERTNTSSGPRIAANSKE